MFNNIHHNVSWPIFSITIIEKLFSISDYLHDCLKYFSPGLFLNQPALTLSTKLIQSISPVLLKVGLHQVISLNNVVVVVVVVVLVVVVVVAPGYEPE